MKARPLASTMRSQTRTRGRPSRSATKQRHSRGLRRRAPGARRRRGSRGRDSSRPPDAACASAARTSRSTSTLSLVGQRARSRPGKLRREARLDRAERERPQRPAVPLARPLGRRASPARAGAAPRGQASGGSAQTASSDASATSSGPCRATLRGPKTIAWRGAGIARARHEPRRPRRRRAPSTTRPIASCQPRRQPPAARASRPTSRLLRSTLPARTSTPTRGRRRSEAPVPQAAPAGHGAGAEVGHPDHLHARARRVDDHQPAVDRASRAAALRPSKPAACSSQRLTSAVSTRSG